MDRDLTISGGGTACIEREQDGESGMHIRHALNKVTIRDFRRIEGLHASACRDLGVLHTTISRGAERPAVVVDGNSSVGLSDCSTEIDREDRSPLGELDVRQSPGCMVRIVHGA
jgi:hypothetical protein